MKVVIVSCTLRILFNADVGYYVACVIFNLKKLEFIFRCKLIFKYTNTIRWFIEIKFDRWMGIRC